MSYAKDLTGNRYGRLTVISRNYEKQEEILRDKGRYLAYWNCVCDCGTPCIKSSSALRNPASPTMSCGCLRRESVHCQKNTKENKWLFNSESQVIGVDFKGDTFTIDREDYDKVSQYCWRIDRKGYVIANSRNGTNKIIWIHRLIMDAKPDMVVDHINWNKQDNRKCNLRVATKTQNNINIKRKSNNTTGYTGVSYIKRTGKYRAAISLNKNKIYLGDYSDLNDAIEARHKAELKYHGEWSGENNRKDYNSMN